MEIAQLEARLNRLHPLSLPHLPTPLEPLPQLTARLGGPEIWVKRDDQTGLATGGNKTRKLAFLMAEALAQETDVVLTAGAPQSNHARQTAAAAARLGLACVLVLGGREPSPPPQGNLLLDRLLGAEVRWAGDRPLAEALAAEAEAERRAGRRPYVIPFGGSNARGAAGYVAAMAELWRQAQALGVAFDGMVLASSSGGTQAGLLVGARALGYEGRILGISIMEREESFRLRIAKLASETAALLGLEITISPDEVLLRDDYLGAGYAVVGDLEREAIRLAAQTEGLLVDPVYTGRALGGLVDLIRRGEFRAGQRILFWHTGGTPALFAYADVLVSPG